MAVFVPIPSQAWPMQRGYGFPQCRYIRRPHCRRNGESPFWSMIQEGMGFGHPFAQCGGSRNFHPHPLRVDPLHQVFLWNMHHDDKSEVTSDKCVHGTNEKGCENDKQPAGKPTFSAASDTQNASATSNTEDTNKWIQSVNIGNIDPENIDVRVTGNRILVSALHKLVGDSDTVIAFVRMKKEFEVPTEGVDLDKVRAVMRPDGVLNIEAPRTAGMEDEQPADGAPESFAVEQEEIQPGECNSIVNETEGLKFPFDTEEGVSQPSHNDDESPLAGESSVGDTLTEDDSLTKVEEMEVSQQADEDLTNDVNTVKCPTVEDNVEDFEIVSITPTGNFHPEEAEHNAEENQSNEADAAPVEEHQIEDPSQFKIQFNLADFLPEDISVKTVDQCLSIHAKHTEESDGYRSLREVFRSFPLPVNVDVESLKSTLGSDGTFTVVSQAGNQ